MNIYTWGYTFNANWEEYEQPYPHLSKTEEKNKFLNLCSLAASWEKKATTDTSVNIYIQESPIYSWRDKSIIKVLVSQAWEHEFDFQYPYKNLSVAACIWNPSAGKRRTGESLEFSDNRT